MLMEHEDRKYALCYSAILHVYVKSLKQNISSMEQEEFKNNNKTSNETYFGKKSRYCTYRYCIKKEKRTVLFFPPYFYLFIEFFSALDTVNLYVRGREWGRCRCGCLQLPLVGKSPG